MRTKCLLMILILMFPLALCAKEQSPCEFYYKFVMERNQLREKFSRRNQFIAAFKPLRSSLKKYVEITSPDALREHDLFYFCILARFSGDNEKAILANRNYLERFPRGLFVDIVRKELYKRLTSVNKIKEAEKLLPELEVSRVSSYFEDLTKLAWAYQREDDFEGALKLYRKILEETILRSGHGPLPSYLLGRNLSSMCRLMQNMGKSDEALALFKEAMPKLVAAPDIQRRIKTLINTIELMGAQAPELKIARWINGEGGTIKSLRGKVVLLDFWATWCGPCIKSFPELKEIQEEFAGQDFVLLGPTKFYGRYRADRNLTEEKEASRIAEAFVPKHGITWPLGMADGDETFNDYGITGLPTVILIDKEGKVRDRITGYKEENKERIIIKIRQLLQE